VPGHEAYTLRVPYGVCAFIFPWNFPFLLLCWGISPALAAGNCVVVKPAEDTPLSSLYFCYLAREAGVPSGVVGMVPGYGETAGASLASHPGIRRISFTGSPEVGRKIAAACGANLVPAKLELGGKGAAVVFEDADVESAADALASAVTLNAGQVCCTATRWVVHSSARVHLGPMCWTCREPVETPQDWLRDGYGDRNGSGGQRQAERTCPDIPSEG
jgi:acyl-CoA reductase-like NAD-dependent aldehyde dehydrogenase